MTNAAQLAQYGSNNVGLSFKNRIINGAMTFNQRGASNTSNGYALDRWKITAITGSKMTVQQSTDAPTGFSNSMLITSSAATTIGTNDYYDIGQLIEGFNTSDLMFGTANAQTVTVSFWAKSSLTGTFGGSLQNSAQNRSYPFTFNINSANTWEYKTITIAGDTTGTWVGATNGTGVQLLFGLGLGSVYQGTAGAWTSGYRFPTGAVALLNTNAATLQITGVQLEKGSTATSFDYLPYSTELMLCQRYFQNPNNDTGFVGRGNGTTGAVYTVPLIVPLRASPTITTSGDTQLFSAGGFGSGTATHAVAAFRNTALINLLSGSSGGADNRVCMVSINFNMSISAEL
jgi:hypothetical protein